MNKDIGKTAIVFGIGLGKNLRDFRDHLIQGLEKAYKLSRSCRRSISDELWIWLWTLGEHYGSLYLFGQGLENEGFLYKQIFEGYFILVFKGKYPNQLFSFYNDYIDQIFNMDQDTYKNWGPNYDERVKDKMISMLTLRILGKIEPKTLELKADELNAKHAADFDRIQGHVETIFYFTLNLIHHYLIEATESEIERLFSAVSNEPLVNRLLKNLKNKFPA